MAMPDWTYTERDATNEDLPDVPRPADVPHFTVEQFPLPDRKRVYLANGVIGLRLPAVPFLDADVAVSGLVGRSVADGMESAAPAPYPVGADIVVGHDRLSERPDLVTVREQSLDMFCGELTTRLVFRTSGAALAVEVLTFVPRSLPTVVCQQIAVTPEEDCELRLESRMDPTGLRGSCRERRMPDSRADGLLWWETRDALSSVGAAFRAELSGVEDVTSRQNDWGNERELCMRMFTAGAGKGQTVVMRQIGALVPSIMHTEPHWQALRMVAYATYQGFDWLRHANRKAWADIWPGRPRVNCEMPDFQRMVDSAFFYLHSSLQRCTPCSLPPFGLSRTEGYYNGHVFVDHEHVMFYPLLLTAPDAVRATLDYRSRRLRMARMNARCQGTTGILFPWQSGMHGDEVTRPHATGCVMEYSNPAIATAFLKYARATGDGLFLREEAWPVVRGIAEWICTRVTLTERGYEVRNLTASESFANTHNEPETCRGFIRLLREAIGLAEQLGLPAPARWAEVADNILVLTDPEDLARETAAGDFERHSNLNIAEKASLPFGAWDTMVEEVRNGNRGLARELAEASIEAHWQPDFGGWREYGLYWNLGEINMDCFLSNPGALLRALLFGLPRLEIKPDPVETWCTEPVTLPEGWETIEAERLWIRGQPTRLVARHGAERAELNGL
jgi:trehalose/maltose hydrolase-like predicted phosphorylase